MRLLMIAICVLALLWGGYWFIGAFTLERALVGWIEDRRAEGWAADYADVKTRGFPNRFDTTLTDLALADPETGVAWNAPFFQVLSLSYQPYHVIAIWPDTQTLAFPDEKLAIGAAEMKGSIVFEPKTSLPLDRTQIALASVSLASDRGWDAALREGRFAMRQVAEVENSYDIGFEALGLRPARDWLSRIASATDLPDEIAQMKIDATVGFDVPWDRAAIEVARPQPRDIDLKLIKATWGDLDLQLAGKVAVDAEGVPEGDIAVQARNWRDMLDLAVRSGALAEDLRPTVERGLEVLAGLSGNPDAIDATLRLSGGLIRVGPIPIGTAPRLILR